MLRYVVPFAIALATVFSASLGFAHSGGQAVAIFVDTPPVIDGEDDWPKAVWEEAQAHDMHMKPEEVPDWFIFSETSPNRISRGHIDDNNDLSVEFAFMFDDEWLYYIAKVIDDHVPDNLQSGEAENKTPLTAPHTSLWVLEFDYEHDAPIKPKGNDDRELARLADCHYQPGDHVYQLKPWTGIGQTQPACFESRGVYNDKNYFNSHCTFNVAAKRTEDGFIIEGRLNFKAMFELAAKPNLPVPTDGSIWVLLAEIDSMKVVEER